MLKQTQNLMRRLVVFLFAVVISANAMGQVVETIRFSDLRPRLETPEAEVLIVNFWATWCKPCVEELPYFEAVQGSYNPAQVKVLLVSMDFPRQKESKLLPFIKKHSIASEVVLLDETDFNAFIDIVSPEWSGAIPATVFIAKSGRKAFFGAPFEKGELNSALDTFMNP